jgi:hypothetical protein
VRDALAIIGIAIAAFCGVVLLAFGLNYASLTAHGFFEPRYTAIDAKVFKESVQYNEGMVRDLSELERQYKQADAGGKAALRPIIRHRFEVYDEGRLPADLAAFYDSIK